MVSTPLPMLILRNDLHSLNALSSITLTVVGMVTSSIVLFLVKSPAPIPETLYPLISEGISTVVAFPRYLTSVAVPSSFLLYPKNPEVDTEGSSIISLPLIRGIAIARTVINAITANTISSLLVGFFFPKAPDTLSPLPLL